MIAGSRKRSLFNSNSYVGDMPSGVISRLLVAALIEVTTSWINRSIFKEALTAASCCVSGKLLQIFLIPEIDLYKAAGDEPAGEQDHREKEVVSHQPFTAASARKMQTFSKLSSVSVRNPRSRVLTHLMIRSAHVSILSGIFTPISLAVLRLMTNSNFFGSSTGSSAGFAPLRILSTTYAARRDCSIWFAP